MLNLPSSNTPEYERLIKALYNLSNNSDFTVVSEFLAKELEDLDKQLRTAEGDFLRIQGRAQVLDRFLGLTNKAKPLLQKMTNQP